MKPGGFLIPTAICAAILSFQISPRALPAALTGVGPSNGVAIFIPLAFSLGLDATAALVLMTSVYYGAMYGGRISSILLNIPGDEPALMTTLDGYTIAKARAGLLHRSGHCDDRSGQHQRHAAFHRGQLVPDGRC